MADVRMEQPQHNHQHADKLVLSYRANAALVKKYAYRKECRKNEWAQNSKDQVREEGVDGVSRIIEGIDHAVEVDVLADETNDLVLDQHDSVKSA